MANIIRVISKDQKQFERCKKAFQLYEKDIIVYRVTKSQQLELIGSTNTRIVVLPKGFDCMKAWEETELRKKVGKLSCRFYSLTEKKFKELEQGPNIVFETAGQALEEFTDEDTALIQTVKERQGQPTTAVDIDDLLKI